MSNPFDHRLEDSSRYPLPGQEGEPPQKGVKIMSGGHPQTPAKGGAPQKARGPSRLPFFQCPARMTCQRRVTLS